MPQTTLGDMDSWQRVAGTADGEGAFTVLVLDKDAKSLLQQVLASLTAINAQLKAGVKTQSVASVQIL